MKFSNGNTFGKFSNKGSIALTFINETLILYFLIVKLKWKSRVFQRKEAKFIIENIQYIWEMRWTGFV